MLSFVYSWYNYNVGWHFKEIQESKQQQQTPNLNTAPNMCKQQKKVQSQKTELDIYQKKSVFYNHLISFRRWLILA